MLSQNSKSNSLDSKQTANRDLAYSIHREHPSLDALFLHADLRSDQMRSLDASQCSASNAAAQPMPAAVIACR